MLFAMSQILSIENSSLKMYTSLLYLLIHIPLFSARCPVARASEGRRRTPVRSSPWMAGKWEVASAGLLASVATGQDIPRPSGFPREVRKNIFSM